MKLPQAPLVRFRLTQAIPDATGEVVDANEATDEVSDSTVTTLYATGEVSDHPLATPNALEEV